MSAGNKFVGLLGAILAAITLFLATYYPEQTVASWVCGAAAVAAIVYFLVRGRSVLTQADSGRIAKHGANAVLITLAFLGILVVLNVLAVRHNSKWDVTENQRFTLSEQTRKVLGNLTQDGRGTAFCSEGTEEAERVKQLLNDYQEENAKLKSNLVDPDRNPALARQYGIREYGTTVFESGEQSYRTTDLSEEALTNALVRVTREGKKTIGFLSGHGEHGLDDTQRSGYSSAKQALEEQGFQTRDVLLLRDAQVPEDCDVLVLAGPTKPLLEQEISAVRSYLEDGGRALFLLDPQTPTGLDDLLAGWGVELHKDVIIDTMSRLFGGSYTTPILTDYPDHEITRDFQLATFLPLASSLARVEPAVEGVSVHEIARTTPQSWGETDLSNAEASFDPAADYKGPLVAAVLLVREAKEGGQRPGQLVVFGDADFAGNTYFGFSGNGDLFQNVVSYLAQEEDLISIRPKDTKPSPVMLNRAQGATLLYASVVFAPLTLIVCGLTIWWRRRNL